MKKGKLKQMQLLVHTLRVTITIATALWATGIKDKILKG
jgi:hypothetical protein